MGAPKHLHNLIDCMLARGLRELSVVLKQLCLGIKLISDLKTIYVAHLFLCESTLWTAKPVHALGHLKYSNFTNNGSAK